MDISTRDAVSPIVMTRRITPTNHPLQHLEAGQLGGSTPLGDHWDTHTHSSYFMCLVKELNMYRLSASSSAACIPPPDGEMSLPASGECHRHPPTHSWRYGPHGRPRTAAVLPSSVVQHVNPCWRPPVCDGDRSPATSRWLRQCVGTAGLR